MREYLGISGEYVTEFEISRSKFITHIAPVESVEVGLKYLAKIRKEYSDATHNCYAVVGTPESNEFKFGDDGEPSGTAGQPILNALTKNGLYCVCAVVTRYFGGIKLGAGGLVQAYSKACADAVKGAEVVRFVLSDIFEVRLTYGEYKSFGSYLQSADIAIMDTAYSDMVTLTVAVPEDGVDAFARKLTELMAGESRYAYKAKKYIIYKR